MKIKDAYVLITGATGGIGGALALACLSRGARVLATGRSQEKLLKLVRRAGANADRLDWVSAELDSAEGREQLLRAVAARASAPTLLIHAAACNQLGLFSAQAEADIERMFALNVLAPLALTRALLPKLLMHDQSAVVAIGSTFGSIGYPGFAAYSATKFALRGAFESLSREYADSRVRFQWISPRATDTEMNDARSQALNRELGVRVDSVDSVSQQVLQSIESGERRRQLGWPEKLFARLNGVFPELVDRALRAQLPTIRRHAASAAPITRGVI